MAFSSTIRSRLAGGLTIDRYLIFVGAVGTALLAAIVVEGAWSPGELTAIHWVLIAFLVFGELLPIRVPGHEDEVTTSSAFSFALLCILGLAPAAAAQAVASALADLRLGKPLRSALFNVGQYTVSLAAAGVTLVAVSDLPRDMNTAPLGVREVLALAASGVVFFVFNNVLAGTAYALSEGGAIRRRLLEDLGFQAWTAALVLGFTPLIISVAHYDAILLPFLLVPLLAIYRAGRDARRSEYQASHDRLTGLPNRTLFRSRAEAALAGSGSRTEGVAVLVMDLDRFKEINDTLGHHHGDLVLWEVAERLRGALRDTETIARFGGDEFAVLVPGLRSPEEGERVARRLLDALAEPVVVDGLTLRIEASIGLACHPAHGTDIDELVRRADIAMYVAKSRNLGVQRYEAGDDENSLDRLALAGDLRAAIDSDQFLLVYQPLIEVATGRLAGAEALMRWDHPERGRVPPDHFIPTAENTGSIRRLTSNALNMAAAQAARWRAEGLEIPVSVNVSVHDVLDHALPQEIADLLVRHRLPAHALKLELTESMLMADPRRAQSTLHALQGMGVRIAIDDFGTGYSSLAYLARLPVDQLKIDRTFIRDLDQRNNAVIVASTIELARQLGLRTVAEGVESAETVAALATQRCDIAQGYYFSRPLAADDFSAWAHAHVGRSAAPVAA